MATASAAAGRRTGAGRPRSRLRPALRWLHATFGLFAALYVLMASATGAILLFKPEILALAHPELETLPSDPIAQAQRLAVTLERGSFTSIKFPTEALPAYTVYLPEYRTALYDPVTLAPVDDRFALNRAMDWTFELHHYLLAGEAGKLVSGAFGVVIALLVLIGLYLWWPWRKGWKLSHAKVKRPTRAARLAGHTTLAILMAPTLFIAAVSGAAIIFHVQANGALVALLGSKDPAVEPPDAPGSLSMLTKAQFPDAVPRLYIPPAEPDGEATLRLRQPVERHPNGRTTISYDPATARATAATSEPESGAGNRLYNLLYPLHIGTLGGLPMRLFFLFTTPLAFMAAFYGLRSRLTRKRKRLGSPAPLG